jgi:hypothetical protein
MSDLPDECLIDDLAELERLVRSVESLYVRYSKGYEDDAGSGSIDTESGLLQPLLTQVRPLARLSHRFLTEAERSTRRNSTRSRAHSLLRVQTG